MLLEEEEEGCCHAWSRRGLAVPFLPCKVGLGWGGSGNENILNPAPDSSVAKPGCPQLCLLGALSQAQVLLPCASVLSFFAEISGASPVLCVPGPPHGTQQPGRYRQGAGGGCWSCLGWGRVLGSLPSSPRPGRYRRLPQSPVSVQRPPRAGLAASFVGFSAPGRLAELFLRGVSASCSRQRGVGSALTSV